LLVYYNHKSIELVCILLIHIARGEHIHIAVITRDQILPDLEHWVAWQRVNGLPAFNQASNIAIISGPSRTADIAMESILGMHGPGSVHVVILDGTG